MAHKGKRVPPPVTGNSRRATGGPKRKKPGSGAPRKSPPERSRGKRQRPFLVRLIGGIIGWVLRLIWRITWWGSVTGAILLAGTIWVFYAQVPELDELVDVRTRGSVTMMDRNGEVFAWRGEQRGGVVTAGSVAPVLKNAVVATEDKRFYRHLGVSPRGIASAIRINMREGRHPLKGHGGSTLTQQVAKLMCLGVPYDPETWATEAAYEADCRRTSLRRKASEMIYAFALELKFTKDEILTIYLNRAYLGAGAYGFEAASQRYFGKSSAQVNAPEAAMLAGLLTAPSRFAPTRNLDRAQNRAATVLRLMHDQGYISDADRAAAAASPATLSEAAQARAGGYFADWVLDHAPAFLTQDSTASVVVKTTFDQRIQTAAEAGMAAVLDAKLKPDSKAQAAIVIMSADGQVRAMVGGRQTKGVAGAFNRAVMAKRQTGSAFKPFVYATALDLGQRLDDIVLDAPLTIDVPGSGPWSPQNYTRDYEGEITLTDALVKSLNTPAVRVSEQVGRDKVRFVAEEFGIESELAVGPALALGTSESTLLEMTAAYAGILNGGSSVEPFGLTELHLLGDSSPWMEHRTGIGERVISAHAAQQLIYMMNQVVDRGTAHRAALPGWQVAGKTGTTNSARDAWFIGFTADYVAGVWIGNDDNAPLAQVTGGTLPAEIWHEVMKRVHTGLTPRALPMITPAQLPPRVQPEPVFPAQANGGGERRRSGLENVLRAILGGN